MFSFLMVENFTIIVKFRLGTTVGLRTLIVIYLVLLSSEYCSHDIEYEFLVIIL